MGIGEPQYMVSLGAEKTGRERETSVNIFLEDANNSFLNQKA